MLEAVTSGGGSLSRQERCRVESVRSRVAARLPLLRVQLSQYLVLGESGVVSVEVGMGRRPLWAFGTRGVPAVLAHFGECERLNRRAHRVLFDPLPTPHPAQG
jgi:hypothetical protein